MRKGGILVQNESRVRKIRNFDKWLSDYIRDLGSINSNVYQGLVEEAENKKILHKVVIEHGLLSPTKIVNWQKRSWL